MNHATAYEKVTRIIGPCVVVRDRDAPQWRQFQLHAMNEPVGQRVIGEGYDRFQAIDDAQATLRSRGKHDAAEDAGDAFRDRRKEADLRGWS